MSPSGFPSLLRACVLLACLVGPAAAQIVAAQGISIGGAGENYSSAGCLSPAEGRRALARTDAVSLAEAARVARGSAPGEVVDYKICRGDGAYSYVLTILGGNGKVARAWIDASSGKLLSVK
jgi:uncharacterized membrane protein YkoI